MFTQHDTCHRGQVDTIRCLLNSSFKLINSEDSIQMAFWGKYKKLRVGRLFCSATCPVGKWPTKLVWSPEITLLFYKTVENFMERLNSINEPLARSCFVFPVYFV